MDRDSTRVEDTPQTAPGPWLERSVVGLLRLITDSLWTAWAVLTRPHKLGGELVEGSARAAPPFSFLIVSLLAAGVAVRLAILYFDRAVDESLLRRLGETAGSLELEDILLLTVPCVVLVKMTAAGVARWARPHVRFEQNPVVASICYAAGFQCLAIAGLCGLSLIAKILTRRQSILPSQYEDEAVLTGAAFILGLSTVLVYSVMRAAGTTPLARSRIAAGVLSIFTAATTLVGMLIVNSISFDLESTIAEVRQQQERDNLGDVKVAVRTLASRIEPSAAGEDLVEVTVALMNISDETLAVPRPRELRHAWEPTWPAVEVIADSLDWTGQAGWIIPPGDTRLTTWTLRLPEWCSDARQRWGGLPITLTCTPLDRKVNLAETHPVGDPLPILTTLKLPPQPPTNGSTGDAPRMATEPWPETPLR